MSSALRLLEQEIWIISVARERIEALRIVIVHCKHLLMFTITVFTYSIIMLI